MTKSKKISLGAIITVISVILMYATTVLPTAKIFLLSLSSFLIAILIIESGKSTAMLSFISTSIIGFVLLPNKLLLIPFVSFLGYYPIAKLYIERINNLLVEWILKLILFNISAYLNYILFTSVFAKDLEIPFAIGFVALGLQIVFIVYDYMFSMFIHYYNTKLRKYVK